VYPEVLRMLTILHGSRNAFNLDKSLLY